MRDCAIFCALKSLAPGLPASVFDLLLPVMRNRNERRSQCGVIFLRRRFGLRGDFSHPEPILGHLSLRGGIPFPGRTIIGSEGLALVPDLARREAH